MGEQSIRVNTLTQTQTCHTGKHGASSSSWSRHTLLWAALCSWLWWTGGFSCLRPGAVRKRGVVNMQLTAPLESLDLPLITFSCSANSVLGDPYQFTQTLHRAGARVKQQQQQQRKTTCVTPVYTEESIPSRALKLIGYE